jgi:hypothetical protein
MLQFDKTTETDRNRQRGDKMDAVVTIKTTVSELDDLRNALLTAAEIETQAANGMVESQPVTDPGIRRKARERAVRFTNLYKKMEG